VGSHCRSDQLNQPDPLNFLIKPDQAWLKFVYTTSSRPLVGYRRLIIHLSYMQVLHDLSLTSWTSALSPPDLHPTRLLHECFLINSIIYLTKHDCFLMDLATGSYSIVFDMSKIFRKVAWVMQTKETVATTPDYSYRQSQTSTKLLDRACSSWSARQWKHSITETSSTFLHFNFITKRQQKKE